MKEKLSDAQWEKAFEILKLYLEHFDNWLMKGNVFADLGYLDEAISCFRRATEENPNFAAAWHNLAKVLRKSGRHQEALSALDKALQLNPKDVFSWLSKAQMLLKLDRLLEALRCFNQAMKIDPEYKIEGLSTKELREAFFKKLTDKLEDAQQKGDYNEGISLAEEAIAILEGSPLFHQHLAIFWATKAYFLAKLNRRDEAIFSLAKAIHFDPELEEKIREEEDEEAATLISLLDDPALKEHLFRLKEEKEERESPSNKDSSPKPHKKRRFRLWGWWRK